jgi:hypothetical protein
MDGGEVVKMPAFSTCVALDFAHFRELQLASQTWKKNRPEMWLPENPLIIFVDTARPPKGESIGWWWRKLERCIDHPHLQVVAWPDVPGSTQRHRMLSAFVYGVAEHAKTDIILKIDTDCLALKPPTSGYVHPNWWREKDPWAFVSSAWSYTKNIDMWHRLLKWCDTIPALANGPELPGREVPERNQVRHQRIISYVFFARTEFIRECASFHPGPLMPIESQDTWLWAMAVKLGRPWAGVRMRKFSWHHGARGMEKRVAAIMKEV